MSEASFPRDSVFTTFTWDGSGSIADLAKHLVRISEHSTRLRLSLPDNLEQLILANAGKIEPMSQQEKTPQFLLRCEIKNSGNIELKARKITLRNEEIEAITCPAPRWNRKVTGTKHGDWKPYTDAKQDAYNAGADLALLVYEHHIIDGDRASPILMDEDGVVWYSSPEYGGVESITREIVLDGLTKRGYPVQSGMLNERMVARAIDMVALGSGMGASRIITIDDVDIGGENSPLCDICREILAEHYASEETWTKVVV